MDDMMDTLLITALAAAGAMDQRQLLGRLLLVRADYLDRMRITTTCQPIVAPISVGPNSAAVCHGLLNET